MERRDRNITEGLRTLNGLEGPEDRGTLPPAYFCLLPFLCFTLCLTVLAYLHGKTNTTLIKLMKKHDFNKSFSVLPSTVSDFKISLGPKFKGPLKVLGGNLGSNTHPRLISDGLREDSYIPGAKYLLVFLTFPIFSTCSLKRMLL